MVRSTKTPLRRSFQPQTSLQSVRLDLAGRYATGPLAVRFPIADSDCYCNTNGAGAGTPDICDWIGELLFVVVPSPSWP